MQIGDMTKYDKVIGEGAPHTCVQTSSTIGSSAHQYEQFNKGRQHSWLRGMHQRGGDSLKVCKVGLGFLQKRDNLIPSSAPLACLLV